ncbi:MAG: glutamate--tRNA ligase [Candidatus Magasanikbacteria bacterium CG_4_10_14_0_2_um_filter_33_14]|uniref:Glutamate--tRNA ligase n=1 Tax=Candidatus Magasanikbacteria bacterium CG_4_10_14_0_2_um_filter_33_14 TaxID=1974636 RepID=A0A2M7VAJ1_9BACT|nr:MAG: glutamate--tRNA ligase [Candidatus Magasanikbacteria bacterium CG_4_10_14_0_2_um_filter_33_14]
MIRTRFAPSPTGYLHIGGLRTALYAYLFAKKHEGKFLIRIEDTDRERLVEDSLKNILDSFVWANISIDEGVLLDNNEITQKGDKGPYIQSERLEIYQEYIKILLEKNDAYHCFCTKERLDEMRKNQEENKLATGYDGHCRNLTKEEVASKLEAGEKSVIRMKMPKEGITVIDDLIRGKVEFKNELIDDQVLIKADGFPTYHFAVVVDDHLMEISHVVRGEEWLASTPKHINLYKMFGWEAPEFAHLSLLINEKKQKLSKRHGDVSVVDYVKKGYLPEAFVNFIAFLGWNPGDDREFFTLEELEKEFDFDKVGKAPAVFNIEKLNWYNKQYIMKMSKEELAKRCGSFFQEKNVDISKFDLAQVVGLEQGRANTLLEIVENTSFIFSLSEYDSTMLVWKKSDREKTKANLEKTIEFLENLTGEWNRENLETTILNWIKEQELGNGDVLWPMRVALSGLRNSPGPLEIASVLGKTETLNRMQQAVDKI